MRHRRKRRSRQTDHDGAGQQTLVYGNAETEINPFRYRNAAPGKFAGGRLATLGLDYLITYFGAIGLSALFPALNAVSLFGREWNLNEIGAKVVAAVVVVVSNYFFSKFLVFRKKKKEDEVEEALDPAPEENKVSMVSMSFMAGCVLSIGDSPFMFFL